jgi:hypothetical protein
MAVERPKLRTCGRSTLYFLRRFLETKPIDRIVVVVDVIHVNRCNEETTFTLSEQVAFVKETFGSISFALVIDGILQLIEQQERTSRWSSPLHANDIN